MVWGRVAAAVLVAGAVVANLLPGRLRTDLGLQDALATPAGYAGLTVAVVAVIGSLVVVSRRAGWRPYLWACLAPGLVSFGMLQVAQRVGWLGGTVVRPGPAVQFGVYGLAMIGVIVLPLGLFRLLRPRHPVWAYTAYVLFAAGYAAASVPALRGYLANGAYVMGHGYSIFWDVTWGVLLHAAGLGLDRGLERLWRSR